MRFEKPLHWSEGLFLQQHHFQYFQRFMQTRDRQTRELLMAYPWGFLQVETDDEALENLRVAVTSVAAVFPGGTEIAMPGNAAISPLDLKDLLSDVHEPFMVYLALPRRSDIDGNLAEDPCEKRMYLAEEISCRDDYTGKSEISMVGDRLNVRITTSLQENKDLDLLPLMRLIPQTSGISELKVETDHNFLPPFLLIDGCSSLMNRFRELVSLMKRRRDKILNDLQVMGYTPELFSGATGHSVMQLSILNESIGRYSSFADHGHVSPYFLYLDLCSLAGKLSALQPLRNWETISRYRHEDSAPQFDELFLWIRAMLLADGGAIFLRLDFEPDAEKRHLALSLKDEHIAGVDEYYLAVHCNGNAREIVNAVETGDNFRMTAPSMSERRIRGLKLIETRYPPRYFPALPDTVWFKVEKEEGSAHIWRAICEERGIVLDWADSVFPELEASLFLTLAGRGDTAK